MAKKTPAQPAKGKTGKRPGAPYDAKPTKAEGGKGKGPKPVIRVNRTQFQPSAAFHWRYFYTQKEVRQYAA